MTRGVFVIFFNKIYCNVCIIMRDVLQGPQICPCSSHSLLLSGSDFGGVLFHHQGKKQIGPILFQYTNLLQMLIFLDSRHLEPCQKGEENQNRFSVVITKSTVYL